MERKSARWRDAREGQPFTLRFSPTCKFLIANEPNKHKFGVWEKSLTDTESSAWNCLVCLLLKHQFCKILMKHLDLNSNQKSANPKATIWWKALKLKRRKFESSASWTFKNWTAFKKNVITLDFLTITHCLLMPKACRSLQFACGDCEEGRKVSASSQKIPTETLGWVLGWKPKKRETSPAEI